MKIDFYFDTLEKSQELEIVLKETAKQHFDPYDYCFTTFTDTYGFTGYVQVHLKCEAYFNDLDKVRETPSRTFCKDVLENLSFVSRIYIE